MTNHEIRYCLSAAAVEAESGVIRGATVAKSGVVAQGKYVFLDASGQITKDEENARQKIPVITDDQTLETLLAAAKNAGGRVKVRSDHNDSLSSRAGFANVFRRDGDRVACDLKLFDNYKDRAIVIEAITNTPDEIGLSIDFIPWFEINKGTALLRVKELNAVDIVDQGAITPAGMFLNSTVDSGASNETANKITMAEQAPDKIDQCLSAINKLADGYASLSTKVDSCMSAVAKLSEKPADKKDADGDNDKDGMAATLKDISTKLAATQEAIATMKKEAAALGLRSTSEGAAAAASSAADESTRAKAEPKTFLELVAEVKAEGKLSGSDAHRFVMSKNPDAYAAHLASKGIAKK